MSRQSLHQVLAPAAAAIVLLLAAAPASARQEAGVATAPSKGESSSSCSLERVGTQYVKCDDLTGNGTAAPGWVKARSGGQLAVEPASLTVPTQSAGASGVLLKFRRHGM